MNNLGIWAGVAQALVVLIGGSYGLYRFAKSQGRREAKLDRIIKQVEPNTGTSLRDDVQKLRGDFREFSDRVDRRLQRLEAKA